MELPTGHTSIDVRTSSGTLAQCADAGVAGVAPSAAGATPSNTAPAICIPDEVTILLTGIDSVYVSYRGCLLDGWDARLDERKQAAQSDKASEKLQAQLEIAGHMFVVHDRGRGPFAYIISDNWFDIALARPKAKSVPVAYIQISSEALLLEGCDRVLADLDVVLRSLADIENGPNVSRADLRADFVATAKLSAISAAAWVTRARDRTNHFVGRQFSG